MKLGQTLVCQLCLHCDDCCSLTLTQNSFNFIRLILLLCQRLTIKSMGMFVCGGSLTSGQLVKGSFQTGDENNGKERWSYRHQLGLNHCPPLRSPAHYPLHHPFPLLYPTHNCHQDYILRPYNKASCPITIQIYNVRRRYAMTLIHIFYDNIIYKL